MKGRSPELFIIPLLWALDDCSVGVFWFGEETNYWYLTSWCWFPARFFFFFFLLSYSFGFVQHSGEFRSSFKTYSFFFPYSKWPLFFFSLEASKKYYIVCSVARWLLYVMMRVVYFTHIFMFSSLFFFSLWVVLLYLAVGGDYYYFIMMMQEGWARWSLTWRWRSL